MADNKHGSEEWDAPPPNVGGNGMEEEPLSQERKSMRAFLAGLGGRIATSRYDDAFIAAGFDNVEMLNVASLNGVRVSKSVVCDQNEFILARDLSDRHSCRS